MKRLGQVLLISLALIGLTVGVIAGSSRWAFAQAGRNVFVRGEFVRNGGFDYYNAIAAFPYGWWFEAAPGDPVKVVSVGGNPVLRLQPPFSLSFKPYLFIWQEIHIPKRTDVARLSFRFRIVPDTGQARIRVQFETDTGRVLGNQTFTSPWYASDTGWVNDTTNLPTSLLQAFNTAYANGERVRMVIGYERTTDDGSYLLLDDISLYIEGYRFQPALEGAIAFISRDRSTGRYTVEWIRPDGTDRTRVFTYPSSTAVSLWSPAWRPDGSEIAFASGHEMAASPYLTDIYAVRPDGSGLRRITNPPAMSQVQSGYPYGAVTGRLFNDYGPVTAMNLYVMGAKAPVGHHPGGRGATTTFTIYNVADLGPGVDQPLIITWGDGSCATGVEWEVGTSIDIRPGQVIDIGTITFDGDCNKFEASNPTWNASGTEVGFSGAYLARRAYASGEFLGRPLFNSNVGLVGKDLDWSPAGNEILFQGESNGTLGIHLTQVGGTTSTTLVRDADYLGAVTEEQAWLPDGSTFVYSLSDGSIYEFVPNGTPKRLLALNYETVQGLSVSPDGNYIVFERVMGTSSELWILDRQRPNVVWPLVTDYAADPDWGRRSPASATPPASPTLTPTPVPTHTPVPTATPTPPSTPTPPPTATPFPTPSPTPELPPAECADPYEPNNDFDSATIIGLDTPVEAFICPEGDEDWFSVDLEEGSIVEVTLTELPADYDLFLYDPTAVEVAASQEADVAPERIVYEVPAGGAYRVRVIGYQGVFDPSTPYLLFVRLLEPPGGEHRIYVPLVRRMERR